MSAESGIRVRFAPSPTGHLHIGGVRTALFNYLYARNQEGKFMLRIEDTDRERSRDVFEKEIIESLGWLGLKWDGEIMRQSKRLAKYREAADDLLHRGLAYEEKSAGQTAVKFKMPKDAVIFTDLIHADMRFDASLFDDLVIIKSDGYPTYHFACVVDDHDTAMTHVIRGDDHLSNTPRQILLFAALGWKPPKYGHLPLILGSDGTPLSKRHGAVSLEHYRAEGYLAEGLLNYLALLGWGPKDNQEFFRLDDLVKKFTLKRVNKANTQFDPQKLAWLNGQHVKKMPEQEYLQAISEYYKDEAKKFSGERWKNLALLYRSRIQTFKDLRTEAAYCFDEIETYPNPLYEDYLKNRPLKAHLDAWAEKLGESPDFDDPVKVESTTREVAQGWGIEAKDLIHPLRFALTGRTVSPGLFEMMSVMGKETCLKRIYKFLGRKQG